MEPNEPADLPDPRPQTYLIVTHLPTIAGATRGGGGYFILGLMVDEIWYRGGYNSTFLKFVDYHSPWMLPGRDTNQPWFHTPPPSANRFQLLYVTIQSGRYVLTCCSGHFDFHKRCFCRVDCYTKHPFRVAGYEIRVFFSFPFFLLLALDPHL